MLNRLRTRYNQFVEHQKEHGLLSACKIVVYKYEEAVPVEKDLSLLKPLQKIKGDEFRIQEVTEATFARLGLPYTYGSRRERAPGYFRNGYQSFVLIKNHRVVGDIWYVTAATAKRKPEHPHLRWFDIELGKDQVYMFDMFVDPRERGSAVTTFFLHSVLHLWKDRGYSKAYGYFVADYVPALWVHRLLGYQERPHHIVRRYLMFDTVRKKLPRTPLPIG